MTDGIFIVGLTGPTGSGKSEVAQVLAEAGIPIIDADVLARRVVEPGTACLERLTDAFSKKIRNDDGTLNRGELAKRAFSSQENTRLLNSITHPYIIRLTHDILKELAQLRKTAVVIDAPLLFESGMDAMCDRTVAVTAPESERLRRIMQRDRLEEEKARARMNAQNPEAYYTSRAAVVLFNDGEKEALREQARRLAQQIGEWVNDAHV